MPPLILITRPREAAEAFAADLRARLGPEVDICIAPLLEIEYLDALPDLTPYGALIFTSRHAVTSFARATRRRNFICYTVGEATGATARDCGFDPVVGPGTGKGLAAQILRDTPTTSCLYLHGDHVAFDIAGHLNASGTETHDATLYRQIARPMPKTALRRLKDAHTVIAPVFSPRSAQLLLDALPNDTSLHIAAISNAVAAVMPEGRAAHVEIADSPDNPAMLTCVATLWRNTNRVEGRRTAQ